MKCFLKFLGLLVLAAIAVVLIFGPAYVDRRLNPVDRQGPHSISAQAQALHNRLIIGDWHADTTLWKRDVRQRHDRGMVDLPRLQAGNVALQMFTAVTKSPSGLNYGRNSADTLDDITLLATGQLWPPRTWTSLLERALYQAQKLHEFAATSDGQLRVITNRAELDQLLSDRAAGQQVIGGLLGIEGAHPLEGKIENLDLLVAAGHRMIGLQHFFDNELGGSLHGISDGGLTDFGRQVVTEIQSRNLILDLAHSSHQVVRDVLEMTDMPIVNSHTGIYSHCQSPRNIPDELIKGIADTGGVIAIGFWADVTCDHSPTGVAAAIRAAVALVGEDHVSLGSDFDGSVRTGFDASELAALTQALLEAGLNEAQIAKVMGGNMVRVLRERLP